MCIRDQPLAKMGGGASLLVFSSFFLFLLLAKRGRKDKERRKREFGRKGDGVTFSRIIGRGWWQVLVVTTAKLWSVSWSLGSVGSLELDGAGFHKLCSNIV